MYDPPGHEPISNRTKPADAAPALAGMRLLLLAGDPDCAARAAEALRGFGADVALAGWGASPGLTPGPEPDALVLLLGDGKPLPAFAFRILDADPQRTRAPVVRVPWQRLCSAPGHMLRAEEMVERIQTEVAAWRERRRLATLGAPEASPASPATQWEGERTPTLELVSPADGSAAPRWESPGVHSSLVSTPPPPAPPPEPRWNRNPFLAWLVAAAMVLIVSVVVLAN